MSERWNGSTGCCGFCRVAVSSWRFSAGWTGTTPTVVVKEQPQHQKWLTRRWAVSPEPDASQNSSCWTEQRGSRDPESSHSSRPSGESIPADEGDILQFFRLRLTDCRFIHLLHGPADPFIDRSTLLSLTWGPEAPDCSWRARCDSHLCAHNTQVGVPHNLSPIMESSPYFLPFCVLHDPTRPFIRAITLTSVSLEYLPLPPAEFTHVCCRKVYITHICTLYAVVNLHIIGLIIPCELRQELSDRCPLSSPSLCLLFHKPPWLYCFMSK